MKKMVIRETFVGEKFVKLRGDRELEGQFDVYNSRCNLVLYERLVKLIQEERAESDNLRRRY